MENKVEYLLELKKTSLASVRDTWVALGSLTVNTKTKFYTGGTFFQVKLSEYDNAEELPELYNALVYCENDYRVDNDKFPMVDWANGTTLDVEGHCSTVAGIMLPHFRVILTGEEFTSITDPINEDYIPFNDNTESSSVVQISENDLQTILVECGCPFIRIEELEYTRDVIKNTCIKPALEYFFGFMPYIVEQSYGSVGASQPFKVEFPENAYSVVPYYTQGGTSVGARGTAFGMYNEMFLMGQTGLAGGGKFGKALSYNKSVPGYTGGYSSAGTSALGAAMDALATNQAVINRFKREKFRIVKENGKKYATGYSSIGGNLCFKWLCVSYDWDDIDMDMRWRVTDICKAYVLQNLGMLRSLVPGDSNEKVDYSLYLNRAKELLDPQRDFFAKSTSSLTMAIGRGGLR